MLLSNANTFECESPTLYGGSPYIKSALDPSNSFQIGGGG
jgi:hypothetical protein